LLFRRRPVVFLAVSLLFFFACYKMQITGYLTFFVALLMCQISIVVCIVIARCADESRKQTLNLWYQSLLNSIVVAVLLSAFYLLLWVIAAKVASMLMLDDIVSETSVPPPIAFLQWLYPGTISLFVVYIGVMVTTMWFLLPLSVFYKLGFVDAVLFAKQDLYVCEFQTCVHGAQGKSATNGAGSRCSACRKQLRFSCFLALVLTCCSFTSASAFRTT